MKQDNTTANLLSFTCDDYDFFAKKWKRCRDVYAGSDKIKEKTETYLPKSRWHRNSGKEGEQDYNDYRERAVFYSYMRDAVETCLGILKKGEPTVKLPKAIAFMEQSATIYHDGLTALKAKLDKLILITGCAGLQLEVNANPGNTADSPDFYINIWQPESIKDKVFEIDPKTGESFARLVLLDESDYVFNKESKRRDFVYKWRVLGLDERNEYYTALLKPEQYATFDLDNPTIAADQTQPDFGEAVYPEYRGNRMSRIPFTFVNATDLSGGHYDDPPLYDLVDLVLALYRGDADYRQTLHFTASDFYKHTGCNDPARQKKLSIGAGGVVHLGDNEDISVVSSPGGGANLQKASMDQLHALCQQRIMTMLDVGANQSGAALEIVQNSKSARIEPINQNTGNAIAEQLRYAAEWTGMDREKTYDEVTFAPSKIEDTSMVAAQLIAMWHSMTAENLPVTKEDFHTLLRKANITQNDFEQNQKVLEIERAASETETMRTGPRTTNQNPNEPGE